MKLRKKRINYNQIQQSSLPALGTKILPVPKKLFKTEKKQTLIPIKQINQLLLQMWSGVLKERYRDMNKGRLFKIWKATDGFLDIHRFRLILQQNNLKLNKEQSQAVFDKIGQSEQKISYLRFKQFVEGKRLTISNSNRMDRDLLYLKSKSKKLFSRSKENDIGGKGEISLKTFHNILQTVSLQQRSLDIRPIIEKYVVNQQNINYVQLCKDLDNYQFDFKSQPICNLRPSVLFNRSKIPSYLLHRHLHKGKNISRLLRNYFPQPQQLKSQLLMSQDEVVQAKELQSLLKQFLFAVNQTNKQDSIEPFINLFQFNSEGKTFTKDILDFLYRDSEQQYLTKAAQPTTGPPICSPPLQEKNSRLQLPTSCTTESLFKKLLKIDPDRTGCINYSKLRNYLISTYNVQGRQADQLVSKIDIQKKGFVNFKNIADSLCQKGQLFSTQVYNYVPNPFSLHKTMLFFSQNKHSPIRQKDSKVKKYGRFAYKPQNRSSVIIPITESSLFIADKQRFLSRSLLDLKDLKSREQKKRKQTSRFKSIYCQAERYQQSIKSTIKKLQEIEQQNLRSRKNRLSLNQEFIKAR